MMRAASPGHAVFALVMAALGTMGLIQGKFVPVWEPVPKGIPGRDGLICACAIISLFSGIGLLLRPTASFAARLLWASLLFWLLFLRAPYLILAPCTQDSWSGWGETSVMVAGAWVLHVWLAGDWDKRQIGFTTGTPGLRIARALYGVALICFGAAHFTDIPDTANLVPGWLPFHVAWAYFTGVAFIAAGVAILTGVAARLAAMLSALQIGLFTLLVWVPLIAAGSKSIFQWHETILSAALTAGLGWSRNHSGASP